MRVVKSNGIALVQVVSALLIVNYHTGALEIPILSAFAKFGFVFNTIFVFLSGYLLTQSFVRDRSLSFASFLTKRISRIYPSYHVALLFIAALYIAIDFPISAESLIWGGLDFSIILTPIPLGFICGLCRLS